MIVRLDVFRLAVSSRRPVSRFFTQVNCEAINESRRDGWNRAGWTSSSLKLSNLAVSRSRSSCLSYLTSS